MNCFKLKKILCLCIVMIIITAPVFTLIGLSIEPEQEPVVYLYSPNTQYNKYCIGKFDNDKYYIYWIRSDTDIIEFRISIFTSNNNKYVNLYYMPKIISSGRYTRFIKSINGYDTENDALNAIKNYDTQYGDPNNNGFIWIPATLITQSYTLYLNPYIIYSNIDYYSCDYNSIYSDGFEYGTLKQANNIQYANIRYQTIQYGYDLTFDSCGGSSIDNLQHVETIDLTNNQYIPTRDGYIFKGWFYDIDYNGVALANIELTQATTVYAKWAESYTVYTHFHNTDVTVYFDDNQSLNLPSEHYISDYSFQAAAGEGLSFSFQNSAEGFELYEAYICTYAMYPYSVPHNIVTYDLNNPTRIMSIDNLQSDIHVYINSFASISVTLADTSMVHAYINNDLFNESFDTVAGVDVNIKLLVDYGADIEDIIITSDSGDEIEYRLLYDGQGQYHGPTENQQFNYILSYSIYTLTVIAPQCNIDISINQNVWVDYNYDDNASYFINDYLVDDIFGESPSLPPGEYYRNINDFNESTVQSYRSAPLQGVLNPFYNLTGLAFIVCISAFASLVSFYIIKK